MKGNTGFEALLAALPQPAALLDAQGVVMLANPAAQRLCGGELHGRRLEAAAQLVPCGACTLALLDAAVSPQLEVLGRLAGGIAHDFNNILAVILATAEAMRPGQPPEVAQELQTIEEAAMRGRGMVRRLLSVVRQEGEAAQSLEVNEALRGIAALLHRLLGSGIRLELALAEEPLLVRMDAARWDQMLLNLAVNARDAMQGQGRLRIASSLRRANSGASRAVIEVADDGPGIAEHVLPRVLDPFFTTRPDRGGTGMGLATVQDIVAQAGGEVEVESAPGRGATFRLLLPCLPGASPGAPILFVEDEPGLLKVARLAFGNGAGELLTAEDGESALEMLQGGARPALLVTDVSLPGMDGLALAREARALVPSLPVLFASGYPAGPAGLEASDFLAKPYTLGELKNAVAKALSKVEST